MIFCIFNVRYFFICDSNTCFFNMICCYLRGFMCFIKIEIQYFILTFRAIFPYKETVLRARVFFQGDWGSPQAAKILHPPLTAVPAFWPEPVPPPPNWVLSPKKIQKCYLIFLPILATFQLKTASETDDGGHDIIDNFEFLCNSMENLISIWNFTNTVIENVK